MLIHRHGEPAFPCSGPGLGRNPSPGPPSICELQTWGDTVRRVRRQAIAAAVAAAGLALLAAPAQATTELRQPCPYTWEAGGAQKIIQGCYDPNSDTIYYDTGHTLWHERGHAFDSAVLTDADREWISSRFFGGRPWRTADPTAGSAPASERFAEGYAYCHLKPQRFRGRVVRESGGYGYMAYTARHRQLCNTIAILALVR